MVHISKLVRIKNAILNNIKLDLLSNHLLNKFTKHVKENNRLENLGDIISRFIWLEYYYKLKTLGWSKEETLYKIYTRELNKKLCIELSTLNTLD